MPYIEKYVEATVLVTLDEKKDLQAFYAYQDNLFTDPMVYWYTASEDSGINFDVRELPNYSALTERHLMDKAVNEAEIDPVKDRLQARRYYHAEVVKEAYDKGHLDNYLYELEDEEEAQANETSC